MFKEVVPLSPEQHRTLRLSTSQPFDFVAADILIPITIGEVDRVAREMPIVFPRQGGMPQALAGHKPGHNLHVHPNGQWLGRYIPAHVRRYPFILAEVPNAAEAGNGPPRRFALHIDRSAKHLGEQQGERLFDDAGRATPTLEHIQKVLTTFQQDAEHTQALVAQLNELGLLHEREIKITTADGQSETLTGFRVIDRARLAQLPADTLAALQARGALVLIYAHLFSLTNLQDGWIAKHRGVQGAQSIEQRAESSLKFDNIDWGLLGKR